MSTFSQAIVTSCVFLASCVGSTAATRPFSFRDSINGLLPQNVVQGDVGINDYTTYPYDVSTYVNPNDTYVASEEVKQGTDISSGDFERNVDYVIDGATTPITLFIVGFLSLILFNLCLCCGITKLCAAYHTAKDNYLSCGEYVTRLVFAAFFVICFLATHLLYVGYSDVVDGFDILRSSTNQVGSGFDQMNIDIAGLTAKADDLVIACTTYGCSVGADGVENGVEYMSDDLGDIPERIQDIHDFIDLMENAVTLLMFVMYVSLLISIILYALVELLCKAKGCCAICCGNITFVVVALIGVLWMIITSVTADFCYENPTYNTIDALKASKGQMYVVWYSSCYSGFNPVHRYINKTHAANQLVVDYVGSDNSPAALSILSRTRMIADNLNQLTRSTVASCSPIQDGWLTMMNDGICTSFYEGVRTIWICEVAACISLFVLMITGGIMGRTAKENARVNVMPDGDDDEGDIEQTSPRKDEEYEE